MTRTGREGFAVPAEYEVDAELPFYCVSPQKLAVLSVATLGLYEVYWFYKNWALINVRYGRKVRPFWRALFSPLFCYAFAGEVYSVAQSEGVAPRIGPASIAAVYAGLILVAQLPEPYWIVGLFSFVPLLPVADQIRRIHEAIRPGFDSTVGWGTGSYTTLVVGGTLAGLAIAIGFGPATRVLLESEIPSSYATTLVEAGVLAPQEEIRFFYSAGFFSILEDGNLLTEERVVSYQTVDGEMFLSAARYSEIRRIEIEYSTNDFEDSVLTIHVNDAERFVLLVSHEEGRDSVFVSYLERMRVGPQ